MPCHAYLSPLRETQLRGRGEALTGIKLRHDFSLSRSLDTSGPCSCGAGAMPDAGAGAALRLQSHSYCGLSEFVWCSKYLRWFENSQQGSSRFSYDSQFAITTGLNSERLTIIFNLHRPVPMISRPPRRDLICRPRETHRIRKNSKDLNTMM